MAREDEIRVIAYSIWEGEGCPDGLECEHWYRAEIIWEDQRKPKSAPVAAPAKAAAKPAVRRTAKKTTAAKKTAAGAK
jgi:hypothetical protein